jgi:hypothetical protein
MTNFRPARPQAKQKLSESGGHAVTGTTPLSRAVFRLPTAPTQISSDGLRMRPVRRRGFWADRAGIILSVLCAIHCFLTPILILSFPATQNLFHGDAHEKFHLILLGILPLIAIAAFIPGFRRHRNWQVFAWSLPGLAMIATVALFLNEVSWVSTTVSILGSAFLIQSHRINRRLCACCEIAPRAVGK